MPLLDIKDNCISLLEFKFGHIACLLPTKTLLETPCLVSVAAKVNSQWATCFLVMPWQMKLRYWNHENPRLKKFQFRSARLIAKREWKKGKELAIEHMKGDPKNPEFIYKILCIYSYMFKLQSPSKYSPSNAICLSRCFFHCSKEVLNLGILM